MELVVGKFHEWENFKFCQLLMEFVLKKTPGHNYMNILTVVLIVYTVGLNSHDHFILCFWLCEASSGFRAL